MRRSICDVISTYIGEKKLLVIKKLLKAVVFVYIGIYIFIFIQMIFVPKWYFDGNTTEPTTRIVSGFYKEEDDIDVLLLGTSHMEYGLYPMEMYNVYGVTSYNLATSGQPIEVSLYLLKEALKTQNPKVMVLDASALFFESSDNESAWRYVFESMPFSINKIRFANEFMEVNDIGDIYDKLFPLFRYHGRWKEIKKIDYIDFFRNHHLYSKGGYINTLIGPIGIDIATMNEIVGELEGRSEKYNVEYVNGEFSETSGFNSLYSANVPEKNISMLLQMKQMCEEKGVKFLLTKVPSINFPNYYCSSWTLQRSERIKEICEENEIDFFDMMYDVDANLDWFYDGIDGAHLNYKGAIKISLILGQYLKENYDLEAKQLEQWDKDLETYKKVKRVAELQTETDFVEYLRKIANDYREKTVYIVASGDMSSGLSENDVNALRNLGLKADYATMYQDGYIAVIKDGHAQYETYSNQYVEYHDQLQNGTTAYLCSKGWHCGSDASIIINGKDYSMKGRGLNIVVYDEQLDMVWDSLCFDTCVESNMADRTSDKLYYLQQYENYLIEVEDR